jgi:hypothetical protein
MLMLICLVGFGLRITSTMERHAILWVLHLWTLSDSNLLLICTWYVRRLCTHELRYICTGELYHAYMSWTCHASWTLYSWCWTVCYSWTTLSMWTNLSMCWYGAMLDGPNALRCYMHENKWSDVIWVDLVLFGLIWNHIYANWFELHGVKQKTVKK